MNSHDIVYWIALKSIEGVGNIAFKNLLENFGSARAVFDASLQELKKIRDIGPKTALLIKQFEQWQSAEKELQIANTHNVSILNYKDPSYPSRLLNIHDFPVLLYVKGILSPDDIPVAVVGSRMATTYGKFQTERLCRELALSGITVVSGLARGIDSAAHRGALAAKGRTIAVLGSGLDVIYPPENEKLFFEIANNGAVISEFPFGTPPQAANFPARNRIISGISLGVVVVEANQKSGSLITARLALEQGREVFAVPGTIDSAHSRGTNKLIKDGAKLIENIHDILDEILPQVAGRTSLLFHDQKLSEKKSEDPKSNIIKPVLDGLNDMETKLFHLISSRNMHIDEIISAAEHKAGDVLAVILNLELRGLIKQLPGKIYARKE